MVKASEEFPVWTKQHEEAFESIKQLVVSRECLTTIDHSVLGENTIWVMTDASDWGTGAVLSFGKTWESAHPVAFDSAQLTRAEHNYPVHEKELLAIVRALQKFWTDLVGSPFVVCTDHDTLKNFMDQQDLSQQQAHWQEFFAQYDFLINYLPQVPF